MKQNLYMAVTEDKYELPLCVSNRLEEVANFCDLKLSSAYTILSKGIATRCSYGRCRLLKISIKGDCYTMTKKRFQRGRIQ